MPTRKIDALVGADSSPFEYGNSFEREAPGGVARLRIGLDGVQDGCVRELAADLAGPFQLLYLLHTPRTGAEPGRYESPELTGQRAQAFLQRFGPFLAQDARHDFWLRSHDDDATIVLDRHNLIYAYGPLRLFEAVLKRIGARPGGSPVVPERHVHYYHPEWDASERAILKALPWTRKPLREADIQGRGRRR